MSEQIEQTVFQSKPLPGELGDFVQGLQNVQERFTASDARSTIKTIQTVADQHGISSIYTYRGCLKVNHVDRDHVWAVYKDTTCSEPDNDGMYVLDLSCPVANPDFQLALQCFVAGDFGEEELEEYARQSKFHERTLGVYPHPRVRYIGKLVWKARHK